MTLILMANLSLYFNRIRSGFRFLYLIRSNCIFSQRIRICSNEWITVAIGKICILLVCLKYWISPKIKIAAVIAAAIYVGLHLTPWNCHRTFAKFHKVYRLEKSRPRESNSSKKRQKTLKNRRNQGKNRKIWNSFFDWKLSKSHWEGHQTQLKLKNHSKK